MRHAAVLGCCERGGGEQALSKALQEQLPRSKESSEEIGFLDTRA